MADVEGTTGDEPPERTFTIAEVAAIVGAEDKSVRRRTERGTLLTLPKVEVRKGRPLKVIAESEVLRVWPDAVIPPVGEEPAAEQGPAPRGRRVPRVPDADPDAGLRALGAQIERLAGEVATHRLLEAQAGERARQEARARQDAEAEVVELRAREAEARARAERAEAELVAAEHRATAAEAKAAEAAAAPPTPEPEKPGCETPPKAPGFWARLMGKADPHRPD